MVFPSSGSSMDCDVSFSAPSLMSGLILASPFPLPSGHVHLPYSIEDKCTALPYRSHAERNESVLLFAKQSCTLAFPRVLRPVLIIVAHFHEALTTDPAFFTQLADGASFDVVTTAQSVEGQPVPAGLKSLGRQSRPAYDELLSSVKAVIGIGFPYISPTVYSALCADSFRDRRLLLIRTDAKAPR